MKIFDLLTDRNKWTQGACARLQPDTGTVPRFDNPPVESEHPHAQCWCLVGAAEKCYGHGSEFQTVIGKLNAALGKPADPRETAAVANWNDQANRSFEDVRNLITQADL